MDPRITSSSGYLASLVFAQWLYLIAALALANP